jgi:uncharacterized protein YneF (UPF0154 family)
MRTNQIIIQMIITIAIGTMIGYIVGMYIVDKYINNNHKDIDKN